MLENACLNVRGFKNLDDKASVYIIVFNYNVKMEVFDGTNEKG